MTSKPQCSAFFYPRDGYFMESRQCSRAGVVERAGCWYCKQHDPVAKENKDKARHDALMKKWDAQDAAEALRQKHERIGRLVCESKDLLPLLCGSAWAWGDRKFSAAVSALKAILKEVDA